MADKHVIQQKKIENLFNRLTNRFKRTKFENPSINQNLGKNTTLPAETDEFTSYIDKDLLTGSIMADGNKLRSIEDDRFIKYRDYEQMCLGYNTQIPLLNGKSIKIGDWAEKYQNENFLLYSKSPQTNKIEIGLGMNPRVTREKEEGLKIHFNNGIVEDFTKDHLFLMPNGSYKRADKLKIGDKISTLKRKISKKTKNSLDGYEILIDEKEFTHRYVYESLKNKVDHKKKDIHHIDRDKRNNDVSNLKALFKSEHLMEHKLEKEKNLFKVKKIGKFDKFDLSPSFLTDKSARVEKIEKVFNEKWYDISVPGYHNFAIESGCFVHNCNDPLINGGLDIYADEASMKNLKGQVLEINAPDKKTRKDLEDLFYNKIDINKSIWSLIYETVKYGETFREIVFNNKVNDISYLKYVSPYKMFRIERDGKLQGFKYVKNTDNVLNKKESEVLAGLNGFENEKKAKTIPPYKIIHFRLENNATAPYGKGLLESSRNTWKQLELIEDAAIVFRVSRTTQRRVWKIDTGMASTEKAFAYVEKLKNSLRKKEIIDPTTGKITNTKKAISMLEDYWIPVGQGRTETSVTNLDGNAKEQSMADIEYFRDKILFNLKIPKSIYAPEGGAAGMSGKSLAATDMFFARSVERVQKYIEEGLYKLAYVYLILKGYGEKKINAIKLNLVSPSLFAQSEKYEILTSKFNLISQIVQTGIISDVWIYKEILGFSDDEIVTMIGLLQASKSGQDMISVLTGVKSPFFQGEGGEGGENPGEEMERELGPAPGEEEGENISANGIGGESGELEGGNGEEENGKEELKGEVEQKKEKVNKKQKTMSAEDFALKALLNLESVKDKGKRLLIINEIVDAVTKKKIKSAREYLNLFDDKNDEFENHGVFEKQIVLGEFKELGTKLSEIKQKKQKLLNEANKRNWKVKSKSTDEEKFRLMLENNLKKNANIIGQNAYKDIEIKN